MIFPLQITHQHGSLPEGLGKTVCLFASERKANTIVYQEEKASGYYTASFCPLLGGKKLVLFTTFERLIF